MAPSLPLLLVKDNDRSMSLTAHSPTLKFGKFHGSELNYSLTMTCSACIVKWVAENNRPANIVNDSELHNLLTAGRPHATVPSASTVKRDITVSFAKCREKISKLLKVSAISRLLSELTSHYRTILDDSILRPTPGHRPTIGHS